MNHRSLLKLTGRMLVLIILAGVAVLARAGGPVCGDARLGPNENCDDGNAVSGDGCSANCQVEPNYQCSLPFQPLTNSTVTDGGFELGAPSNVWNEFTTGDDNVICSFGTCPEQGQSRQGAWWARMGDLQQPVITAILQDVFIRTSAVELQFDLQKFACDSQVDAIIVELDGVEIFRSLGAGRNCNQMNYRRQAIDLVTAPGGPWNDGSFHELRFTAQSFFEFNGPSIFNVDNVVIGDPLGPPQPSLCGLDDRTIEFENFDPPIAGDFGQIGFTTFELGDPLPWGTTDDGFCGSGEIPPGNYTGGLGEAACIDPNAFGGGNVLSFLCTDALDFTDLFLTSLSFLLNVQFDGQSPDDFFSVLVGNEPPEPGTIGNFFTIFQTFDSIGTFAEPQGQLISLDLSPLDDTEPVYICFAMASTMAFYAQVDDVDVGFEECTDGLDDDKLESCNDNCIDVFNPDQTDSDGDGYGNACDADISSAGSAPPPGRVATGNGNDCITNVLDLGVLRLAFFARPGDANWNPDADLTGDLLVNVEDLGRLKSYFFQPPGPSGVTSICQAPGAP